MITKNENLKTYLPDGSVEAGYSTLSPLSAVASVIRNAKILPPAKVNNKNTLTIKLDALYLFMMLYNSKAITEIFRIMCVSVCYSFC